VSSRGRPFSSESEAKGKFHKITKNSNHNQRILRINQKGRELLRKTLFSLFRESILIATH